MRILGETTEKVCSVMFRSLQKSVSFSDLPFFNVKKLKAEKSKAAYVSLFVFQPIQLSILNLFGESNDSHVDTLLGYL